MNALSGTETTFAQVGKPNEFTARCIREIANEKARSTEDEDFKDKDLTESTHPGVGSTCAMHAERF